ncbi:MAG: type II toxin-antitoxin system RelE/ParE family toxin [Deltaproteobacteria bacterium]|nr:type II toxin-antitoxin system RelE/ParE family toxin [Deltaproteobacteria bacterium]MBI3079125.1 type II toxin-antitoxin system RelE/ParE family toxin [Deltaproteobacteria bacterium]
MVARRWRVVWSEQAKGLLDEAVAYIARDSLQAAQCVLADALEAASSLQTIAERGRIVPEVSTPAIREIFVHRYRLIYEISGSKIEILAFLHGARDFTKWRSGQ